MTSPADEQEVESCVLSHLAVVDAAVLGDGTLPVHQEAVPPPLLRQSVLVALCDAVVQLALLIADGLHILETAGEGNGITNGWYVFIRTLSH